MKKIVITGAAGFIGSHIYDHISKSYGESEIIILDKMTYAADIRNIPKILDHPDHHLHVGDVNDIDLCLKVTRGCDLVVNLAAESHVDNSFTNSIQFTRSNTMGTHTLMEACTQNQVKKIIHVSTDEVYGENVSGPFNEKDEFNPTNPYSASKAAAEMIVKSYYKSFNLPVVIIRANNIYGIRQYPEKIIPKFILRAINGMVLQLHGDGSNLRHYLSAEDIAKALMILINEGEVGEAYNIAGDIELSNMEMAQLINLTCNPDNPRVECVTDRPFNDSRYAVDDSKIRKLGWKPMRSVVDDMHLLVEWYRKNAFRYKGLREINH